MLNFTLFSQSNPSGLVALVTGIVGGVCAIVAGFGVAKIIRKNRALGKFHSRVGQATEKLTLAIGALENAVSSETNAAKYFADYAALFSKYLEALRSLDASVCPPDYRSAYQDYVAYVAQTLDFFRNESTSRARPAFSGIFATSPTDVAERRVAELEARANKMDKIAYRYVNLR